MLPSRITISLVLASVAAYFALVLWGIGPFWETNDDVGMSMISHGYGFIDTGSPNLLFSNILWGYFVAHMPSVLGLDGYAVATYLVLFSISVFLTFWCFEITQRPLFSIVFIGCLMWKPILEPQFTINSGLLMVASVLALLSYRERSKKWLLGFFILSAFVSFLIRDQEAVLITLVALPLIFYKTWSAKRVTLFSVILLGILCFGAHIYNNYAYQTEEWRSYNELNLARAAYTDFNAGKIVKARPEVLAKFDYSDNDIDLISKWFFFDKEIASPPALLAMLSESGYFDVSRIKLVKLAQILSTFTSPYLGLLMLAALVCLILSRSTRLLLAWVIFISIVYGLTLIGRGGVERIYYPVIILLLLYGFSTLSWSSSNGQRMAVGRVEYIVLVILVSLAVQRSFIVSGLKLESNHIINQVLSMPSGEPIVVWGSAIPYRLVYPIVEEVPAIKQIDLIALGVSTLMPSSLAAVDLSNGEGMIRRFRSQGGALMIARERQLIVLNTYCEERHNGQFSYKYIASIGRHPLNRIWCADK
jgi:hypothetical protein